MEIAKTLIVNEAARINSLNLAIGPKAKDLFSLQDEIAEITNPFYRFRDKLAADMGIKGGPEKDGEEKWNDFVTSLTKFLEGTVEVHNVRFLTEDEFWKAIDPLISKGTLFRGDIDLLRGLLVKESNEG